MSEQVKIMESQIREIYGRVIYSHKTHEKCADLLKKQSDRLKMAEILLSTFTTTSILAIIFDDGWMSQFFAALFSTALLSLTFYSKDFNLFALAEKHKQTALDILEIREDLLSLLVDIRIGNKPIEHFQTKRDDLIARLVNTYKSAPKTIDKAYQNASNALKKNEEFTFADDEIDKFLPEALRKLK